MKPLSIILLFASCTSAQLRHTISTIEVGYSDSNGDADLGGHFGGPSITGTPYRGDIDTEAWSRWISFRPFAGLYQPEQEILEVLRPPPPPRSVKQTAALPETEPCPACHRTLSCASVVTDMKPKVCAGPIQWHTPAHGEPR